MRKKETAIVVILLLIYFAHKLFICRFGIYSEECRDGNAYLMFLAGKMPYRDFNTWIYGPFSFCFYPLVFKIFGASLMVFRMSYIAVAAAVIPLVYCLARRLMPPAWAAVAAFLSFVLIDIPYYTYNHIFATIAGLLALLSVARFMERGQAFYLFLAGISAGAAMLVKPLFMGLGILFSILFSARRPVLILAGAAAAIAPSVVYFAAHGSLYKFISVQLPLGPDWPYSLSHGLFGRSRFYLFSPLWFRTYRDTLGHVLPYKAVFSHPSEWKHILMQSYYSFLICCAVLVPLAVFLLNRVWFRRHNLITEKARPYLLLFTVFSVFICIQPLFIFANSGKGFTMQVPFLLSAYLVFLLNDRRLYKRPLFRFAAAAFSACFIIYLSFAHLVRIPYLYSKRYTAPLNIERAKGIRVKRVEKRAYEYIDRLLSADMRGDEAIAVIGYYPQYSFLLERENIFTDVECVWIKFSEIAYAGWSDAAGAETMKRQEDGLIARLRLREPKYIIIPFNPARLCLPDKLRGYIEDNYILIKTLKPTDVDIGTPGKVDIYSIYD